eukprot:TRINITY_DN1643_c0_g2_i2.p1 TRINITY_DN1643_c0_g2~~TRINITY_DN1643_c0_g2_i2.p1  ORF type:complete len:1434 (+),score=252.71 TRINITY_DN1643_c0_g2_i2:90-4391(+)
MLWTVISFASLAIGVAQCNDEGICFEEDTGDAEVSMLQVHLDTEAEDTSSDVVSEDVAGKFQRCKVRICKDQYYGPNNCEGGETWSNDKPFEVDLMSNMEDEISSIHLSSGCEKVILYDEDNDGDTLTATPPGLRTLPGDFDNDVRKIYMVPKPVDAPVPQGGTCTVTCYENDNYKDDTTTYTTHSTIEGQSFSLGWMADEVSSVKLSSGCQAVKLYDDDSDGDTMWLFSSIDSLPSDYDNDVKSIQVWAKDGRQQPLQGRCPPGWTGATGVGTPLGYTFPQGLTLSYYDFKQGSSLPGASVLKDKSPKKQHTVNGIPQFPSSFGSNFYAQWTGALRITKPGEYTFYLKASGGASLTLDGKVLVSQPEPFASAPYNLIKSGVECESSDAWLGSGKTVAECAQLCASTNGCKYFISGTYKKEGNCYYEKTSSAQCSEGFEKDQYDFYQLQDEYVLVKGGYTCRSTSKMLGSSSSSEKTPEQCAKECSQVSGCKFFTVGVNAEAGKCYQEMTSDATCSEGWEKNNNFNFYRVVEASENSEKEKKVFFGAGDYNIRVEYFQRSGDKQLMVKYKGPDSNNAKVDIPNGALFSRTLPNKDHSSVKFAFEAFRDCAANSACCGVAEPNDPAWKDANMDHMIMVGCDVKETGSNDGKWFATCIKNNKEADRCSQIAHSSSHPIRAVRGSSMLNDIFGSLMSTGEKSVLMPLLTDYVSLHMSASAFRSKLFEDAPKELNFLALNAAAKKFGEGKYKTSWGESYLKHFRDNACRQYAASEDLPFFQLPGSCSNFNRWRDYQEWFNDLSADVQNQLLRYAIASIGKELKLDASGDGDDVYYPYQECYSSKDVANKAEVDFNAKLMQTFMDTPKLRKHLYNQLLNADAGLCQWKSFIAARASSESATALLSFLGNQPHTLLVALLRNDRLRDDAFEIFTDLGVLARLLVSFSYNKNAFPTMMWPDDEEGATGEKRTSLPKVLEDVLAGMSYASLLMQTRMVASQKGASMAFSSQDEESSLKGRVSGHGLGGDYEGQTALLLKQLEDQMACQGMPQNECTRDIQDALKKVYDESEEAKRKAASQANKLGKLGEKLSKCLDDGTCPHMSWRHEATSLHNSMAEFHEYMHGIVSRASRRVSTSAISGGRALNKYLEWRTLVQQEKLKNLAVLLADDSILKAPVAKPGKIGKAIQAAKDFAKGFITRIGQGISDLSKRIIVGIQQATSGFRTSTSVASSVFMVSSIGSNIAAVGSTAFQWIKGLGGKVLGLFAAVGVVTDVQGLIRCFDDNNIPLGIFTSMSLIGGVISVVSGVLGVASIVHAAVTGGAAAAYAVVTGAVAGAFTSGFGFGTTAGTSVGPLAPLVGVIVGAIGALGALIAGLLSKPPGSQKQGDQFCCYNFALGVPAALLKGSDNPGKYFSGKTMNDCEDYDFDRPSTLLSWNSSFVQ